MRNTCNLLFTLTLLLTFISIASFGQSNFVAEIDSLIKSTSPRTFNGALLIAQDGEIKYAKTYGFADLDRKIPLNMNDQFIIGSISKQTTAVLVLQELDKGHLSLHEPLSKYLPDLKKDWADSVTIHHLLNHTSGIVGLDQPLAFRQGTQFSYSPIIDDQNGHLEFSHSGALLGFIATNMYEPASKTSMVVLENVAPDFDDMTRAFYFHDQVREIVKEAN